MNYAFQAHRVRQQVRASGKQYSFIKQEADEFGEEQTGFPLVITLNGIYHEVSSYVTVLGMEAGLLQSKVTPMILTSFEEYTSNPIEYDYIVTVNEKPYRVTGITNVSEGNFAIDISLEEVQVGFKA